MANTTASCQLVCLQKTHDPIQLPDGETVIIGRSPQTRITDPRCSRTQLEATADWKKRNVIIKQKGSNPTAIDGTEIGPNCVATMGIDSTLFILSSLFPHKVVFQPIQYQHPSIDKQVNNSHVDIPKEQKVKDVKKNIASHSSVSPAENKKQAPNRTTDVDLKGSKTSSSKRPRTDSNEQQPSKKKMKAEHDAQSNASVSRNGQQDKSVSSKNHNSGAHQLSSAKEGNLESSSKSKITNHTFEKIHGDRAMELDDDDKQLAGVESKLNKMKQDALREQEKVCDKTKSQGSPSSTPSSSSKLKTSSESSSSKTSSHSSSKTSSHSSSKAISESSTHADKKMALAATASDKASWDYNADHYVFTSKGVAPSRKIAGFDLDGTIISTRSGKTFPEDADDWKIYLPEIFHKLKDLCAKKFKIVFFTNQLGVARGKTKIEDLMNKVQNVITKLQVPIQVFIATHEGRYRKPMTGMWEKLVSSYNGGLNIDFESSIYVGDAAGRQANWAPKKKKDFSCSDRLFAVNIGVTFKTPEEFFQNQKPTPLFNMPDFDPRLLSPDGTLISGGSNISSNSKEIIILVGFPASGKSHFATNVLAPKGYVVVNRDTLGSWQKCVKFAQNTLVISSVVIDNTNLSKEERARYVECAKKHMFHVDVLCLPQQLTTVDIMKGLDK